MKKYLVLFIPFLIIFIILTVFYVKAQQKAEPDDEELIPCFISKTTARVLGEVFVLSNPWNDPNELIEYVAQNKIHFESNSNLIRSMNSLGRWLVTNDKSYIAEKCNKHLIDLINTNDLSYDYSIKIMNDFKAKNINCKALGNELICLSEALPELQSGNLAGYIELSDHHRIELQKLIDLYASVNISDPEVDEIIMQDVNCHEQVLADQISLIALLSIF